MIPVDPKARAALAASRDLTLEAYGAAEDAGLESLAVVLLERVVSLELAILQAGVGHHEEDPDVDRRLAEYRPHGRAN